MNLSDNTATLLEVQPVPSLPLGTPPVRVSLRITPAKGAGPASVLLTREQALMLINALLDFYHKAAPIALPSQGRCGTRRNARPTTEEIP